MYTKFGKILKDLRNTHNLTQEDLAHKTNYSKDTIRGVENNRIKPSTTLINRLSYVFNIDLNRYFYAIENDVPVILQETFHEFRTSIEEWDIETLKVLLAQNEGSLYFTENRGLELIYYTKSICEFKSDKYKSLEYVNLALAINNLTVDNLNLNSEIYTITTYNIIGFLGVLYYSLDEFSISEQIIYDLYINLKHNFFSDTKMLNYNLLETIRLYIILLNNLATIELHKNNILTALNYINEAIDICIENYKPKLLHNLYFTKFECLYHLENFNDASLIFEQVLMLSSIIDCKYINIYIDKIENKFTEMLDLIDISIIKEKYQI